MTRTGLRTGLLGGSFNPAHRGHRAITLHAIRALGLDEVWWLVSPGNPLKAGAPDMAPLSSRYASARAQARRAPIRVTAIEREFGTRYTDDTVRLLLRRYPHRRFIWIMGADNLVGFHRWARWRGLASRVPIAAVARPGYDSQARAARAMGWFGRAVRRPDQAMRWTDWSPPALVLLQLPPDPTSATGLRAADPDWHRPDRLAVAAPAPSTTYDGLTRRPIPKEPD